MRFNLKTGLASQKRLSASAVDFPRVNESYTGRCYFCIQVFLYYSCYSEKTSYRLCQNENEKQLSNFLILMHKLCWVFRKQRFVYGTMLDSIAKVTGIIKFDLHVEPADKTKLEVGGNVQGIYDLGPGRFGSEAVFVPRKPGVTSEEDDGYLIFFVHDEITGYSFLSYSLLEFFSWHIPHA